LRSMTGVPSITSSALTRRVVEPPAAVTVTRWTPIGFGRSGKRVLKTPVSGIRSFASDALDVDGCDTLDAFYHPDVYFGDAAPQPTEGSASPSTRVARSVGLFGDDPSVDPRVLGADPARGVDEPSYGRQFIVSSPDCVELRRSDSVRGFSQPLLCRMRFRASA
jgi:hypothetical protein